MGFADRAVSEEKNMGKKPAQKSADDAKKKVAARVEKPKKVAKAATAKTETTAKVIECCKIKGCKREYRAKGYCTAHYRKWRQGEYGVARYKTCHSSECRKPMGLNRHGFCEEHFQKYYVKGEATPVAAPAAKPAEKAADKQAEAS